MLNKLRVLLLLCIAGVLAACGGGGDSTSTPTLDSVDKYVGNWSGCASDLSTEGNVKIRYSITKSSATTGTFKMSALEGNANALVVYTDASCSVIKPLNSFKPNQDVFNFSIVGSTTVQGKTADKIDVSNANGSAKLVWFSAGNQLQIGLINPGADGYPTTLSQAVSK